MIRNKNLSHILFLWLNDKEFHAVNAKKRNVSVSRTYKNLNSIEKIIRRLQIAFNLPSVAIWINNWKNKINQYECIIIHASILTPSIVQYIRKRNKNIRIIVWYWNPVDKCVDIEKFKPFDCEIWSFDETDCEKYNLKYNTQYYFNDVSLPKAGPSVDVFFVGGDKGRIVDLISLKSNLDEQGISNYFHITPTGKENAAYREYYSKRISYDDVLRHIASSKVIVDYVSDKQSGLTLRPLEALFFKRKLITNDKSIEKRDFYCKDNIFIIGKDEFKDLKTFIEGPYREIREDVVSRYDFSEWINRFLLD
jgi:hypothetical protein